MLPHYIESSEFYQKYVSSNMIDVDPKYLKFINEINDVNDLVNLILQLKVWKVEYKNIPAEKIFNFIKNNINLDYSTIFLSYNSSYQFVNELVFFASRLVENDWEYQFNNIVNKNFIYTLKYIRKQQPELHIDQTTICTAIENGYFECLDLLLENNKDPHVTEDVISHAAYIGNLSMLKKVYYLNPIRSGEFVISAIGKDNLDCVKFLLEMGCGAVYTDNLDNEVVYSKFLLEMGCGAVYTDNLDNEVVYALNTAARLGSEQCFNYFLNLKSKYEYDKSRLCKDGAESGKINILKSCIEIVNDLDDKICEYASKSGNLECLQYLHENNFPWTEETCNMAARMGNVECLKYAHENGCPWSDETTRLCATNDNYECLKYAIENGCPYDDKLARYSAYGKSLDCLKYAKELGCKFDKDVCDAAVFYDSLDCLKYARQQGAGWDKKTYYYAEDNKSSKCLYYLNEFNCPC